MNEPAKVKSVRYPKSLDDFIEREAVKRKRTFSFIVIEVMKSWKTFIEGKQEGDSK